MMNAILNRLPPAVADFLWALPGVADRAPVLALAHDGFRLHGALVMRQGKGLAVISSGTSQAVSFSAAVGEVLAQTGGRPRQAILATMSATPALLDLPVEAEHPKPSREMLGLVRWELEPLMAEQIGLWKLGTLLQGRGHLDSEGRAAVANELVRRRTEAANIGMRGGQPPARFAEVALALDLVQRDQVEECLALQTQLQSIDDQIVCACSPRGLPVEGARSLWLAAGLGLAVQSRWIEACQRHGLRLEAIVPLAGASLPLCPPNGVLVEVHEAQTLVTRLRDGLPERLACRALEGCAPQEVLRGMLTELLEPDDKAITLFVTHPQAAALSEQMSTEFGRPVQVPETGSQDTTASPWLPALLGAARQILRQGEALLPRLPGTEPLPPPAKRPQTWALAGALAFMLLVAGYEVAAWGRMSWMQRQLSELTGAKSRRDQGIARAEENKKKAKELLVQTDKLKQEGLAARAELDFYRNDLGGRVQFVSSTFRALSEAASSEVVVDTLTEASWFELSVNAWSLSQSAGYRFAKDVAAALAQWHFDVRDVQVKTQAGRSGQAGYSVQFRLVRAMPGADTAKAKDKKP